jgi:ATP synthase protein I
VAGIFVGGGIGLLLDKWLGTKPLFLLIFFFLGMAAGILNVFRTAKQLAAQVDQDAGNGTSGTKS